MFNKVTSLSTVVKYLENRFDAHIIIRDETFSTASRLVVLGSYVKFSEVKFTSVKVLCSLKNVNILVEFSVNDENDIVLSGSNFEFLLGIELENMFNNGFSAFHEIEKSVSARVVVLQMDLGLV